jgi:hypothetical protein
MTTFGRNVNGFECGALGVEWDSGMAAMFHNVCRFFNFLFLQSQIAVPIEN